MQYEDNINFHAFLNSLIEYKGVDTEKLAYGLYTSSMMYYIGLGKRLPDYLMRNRLVERLGISNDDYEDFVNGDEYARHLEKEQLEKLVEEQKTKEAALLLDKLLDSCNQSEKIEYQFLLDMKSRILMQEKADLKEIYDVIYESVEVTMPSIDLEHIDRYLLASVEYYLLGKKLYLAALVGEMDYETATRDLKKMMDVLFYSDAQAIIKSKIYPYLVVVLYELYKKDGRLKKITEQKQLSQRVDKAINLLRDNNRLFYVVELLEIKEELAAIYDQEEQELNKKFLDVFLGLFRDYDVPEKMGYSCYIYESLSIYNIGQLIKSRRTMLGITRKDLAEGVCTLKTLERIENGKNNPQKAVFNGLLSKLGINADYRRTELLSNDYRLIDKYNEYKRKCNEGDYASADEIVEYLKHKVNKRYPENTQILIRMINLSMLREKDITVERFVKNLKTALKLTKIDVDELPEIQGYLSRFEISCLYNIATKVWKKDFVLVDKIINWVVNQGNNKNHIQFVLYELIMSWYGNILGNVGEYHLSNIIEKELVIDALKIRRNVALAKSIYVLTWNKAQENNNTNINNDCSYRYYLEQSYYLNIFSKRKKMADFFELKIKKFDSNQNWLN